MGFFCNMDTLIIEQDGKKVFLGKEDPNTPPVFVKNPLMRYCPKCHAEATNDKTECPVCFTSFDDGKMECSNCRKFFDFLLGENTGDGKQGCEACWKPPTRKVQHEPERPTGPIFD